LIHEEIVYTYTYKLVIKKKKITNHHRIIG